MADDNNENAKRQVADSKRDYDYDCDNDDNDNNLQQQEQPKHTDKADDDYTKKLQSKLNNHNTSSSDITSVRSLNLLDERMTSKVAAHQQQQQQDMMLQQKAMLNDSASQGSEKGQPWIVSSLVDTTGSHLKSVNDKGITTTTGAHDLPVKVGLDGMGGNSMYQNTGLETGYYSTDEEDNLAIAVPINENDDAEYNSDMFLPAAVEFDPDMKVSPETIAEIQKARKRFIIVFLSIFTLVMVSIGIGIYFGIQKHNRNKEKNQKDPYIHPRTQLGIYEMITSNTNDTDTILQDDMNHPYTKAYNWILYNDPAQLYPNASNFMQRYTLAYLYYATITNVDTTTSTTYNRHWLYCSPPADIDPTVAVNTSECQVTDFYMEREPVIDTNQNHWLSNNDTECEWAGIICDDFGNVREINIGAYSRIFM